LQDEHGGEEQITVLDHPGAVQQGETSQIVIYLGLGLVYALAVIVDGADVGVEHQLGESIAIVRDGMADQKGGVVEVTR
jgi:hypothetical protein